ncbi:MAG: spermidine/putrescine ABC transporter substrate-binding protein [Acidimicrobiia bacterium]|nr:spermidine/putrescine ABC transporter substrate-binding protein [Acidimicrobiia bacterium]
MTGPDGRRPSLGRRDFLRRTAFGLGALAVGPRLLTACGDDDDGGNSGSGGSGGSSTALTHSNWPAYIDEESVELFRRESGIELRYNEDLNDNAEFFAKVQPDLSAGRNPGADIVTPTYWLAGRLITLGWVEEIPFDDIPNADNLVADLRRPAWDPEGRYSLPWQSGLTGIAYNVAATSRELGSFEDLFDPAFRGKIGMLTEMRDTVGLALLADGKDVTDLTFDAAAAAFDRIEQAKSDGQIRQFTGNDYMDDLAAGNFAACIGWSGDIAQLALDNPDLRFVIPEEGGLRFSDTMLIPTGSPNVANAAKWMNYVYDPVNAARIAAYVGYNSPVEGVREELAKDPETAPLAESPLMFPDEQLLEQTHVFASLEEDEEAKFEERFSDIIGA